MQKPDKEWDLAPVEDSDMGKTSLDLAFHFVPRSYEWATSRIQAVERRADSTITWVVSVNLAFVAVVAAVLKGVTAWQVLSTIPFVAVLLAALVCLVCILTLCGRARAGGHVTYALMDYLQCKAEALDYPSFQKQIMANAQLHWEKNRHLVESRSKKLDLALGIFYLEVVLLVVSLALVVAGSHPGP